MYNVAITLAICVLTEQATQPPYDRIITRCGVAHRKFQSEAKPKIGSGCIIRMIVLKYYLDI